MANPGGGDNPRKGKGSRAIQEDLDGGRALPGVNYIPLPRLGGRFGEWFEAPSYEEGVGVDGKIRGQAPGWGLGVSPVVKRSRRNEPLIKGRRKQGCKKTMARPEGAQALRAIQEALDGGRSLPVVNYILPI